MSDFNFFSIPKSNVKSTLYLFDCLSMIKRNFYQHEKQIILGILGQMPDFYFEMKWDFESSVIPLIGKLAPSGKFQVYLIKITV